MIQLEYTGELLEKDVVRKYFGYENEVRFTLANTEGERYFYVLRRDSEVPIITYKCYDRFKCFYTGRVTHIDDTKAWFTMRDNESIVERLYLKAHNWAQKALKNAELNGC
jgi:hypothetical protein